jgi:hypothetical protein
VILQTLHCYKSPLLGLPYAYILISFYASALQAPSFNEDIRRNATRKATHNINTLYQIVLGESGQKLSTLIASADGNVH